MILKYGGKVVITEAKTFWQASIVKLATPQGLGNPRIFNSKLNLYAFPPLITFTHPESYSPSVSAICFRNPRFHGGIQPSYLVIQ